MRRIRIIEHISLDGVIQAPGGPDEDPSGGFHHGGWTAPFADPAVGEAIVAAHGKGFDLLLGRRTYDIWAGYWPTVRGGPFADSFNAATKYVATHRPEGLGWGPAEAVGARPGGDANLVESLRRIKAEGASDAPDRPDLIVWGSSRLTPVLLEHDLADEVVLFVYPVLLGKGKRFYSSESASRELALVSTKATATGVMINTYRPTGSPRAGSVGKPRS